MSYRFLEDVAPADIAFEARAEDLPRLFLAAAEATLNAMIGNPEAIRFAVSKAVHLENTDIEMLLFDLLQELIYHKDAGRLLLRVRRVEIEKREGRFFLTAAAEGEPLDSERHERRADVKAVTLHRFSVQKAGKGWKALVILDI